MTTSTLATAAPAPTSIADLPPAVPMMQMITGALWVTKTIYVAAKLGVADLLVDGPRSVDELAAATATDAPSLYRVLRALASLGIFAEDGDGRFALTPLAATLRSDVPGSLRAMAEMWGEPWHWAAWDSFLDTVRTGTSSIVLHEGIPLFEYFGRYPERAQQFDQAMSAFSGQEAHAVAAAYSFAGIDTLVDLGGGQGLLLATILQANPGLRGVLYELPGVVAAAQAQFAAAGLSERVTVAAGDFFQTVPAGADAYIMKNILHDFTDEQAALILSNCRQALRPGGRVLIVQEPLPAGNAPSVGKLMDMQMLMIGGRERSADEYAALLASAGLRLNRIVPTPSPLSVIEAFAI